MIFSPIDALIFRNWSRPARRRVDIAVGVLAALGGTLCFFHADFSWFRRLSFGFLGVAGGLYVIGRAMRDAERQREEESAAVEVARSECP